MMQSQRRLLPSITALSAFEAVERLASFTAAAEELSLTQSAVSRQVKLLEDQLGLHLLERTSKRVRPTAIGAGYAADVRRALSDLRSATVKAVSGAQGSELRLAILPTFGTHWLMPRIPDFLAAHPGITLSFSSTIRPFDFGASEADAAIYHGLPDWPGSEVIKLADERLVPLAAPALVGEMPGADARRLQKLPRLRLESRPGDWRKWFATQGIEDRQPGDMLFEQFSVLIQACIAGVGIALLPDFLARAELARGVLVQIGAPFRNDAAYYYAQPRRAVRHRSADRFRDWLKTQADPG